MKKLVLYSLSFFIPASLLLIVCFLLEMYPFGENAYLFSDSDSQFVPFLGYFKSLFASGGNYMFSFSKAGGNGMFEFNACYINNPLNFISFLFPNDRLDIAFEAIVIIKTSLAGLGFSYFLNHDKNFDWKTLIFSTAYALSSCSIFYSQSIMGFEGMYFLPVALVGIEKLITCKNCVLFIAVTSLTFILEPYAGWVVLLFSFIYFLYFYLLNANQDESKYNIFRLYFISVLIIIGLGAVITLPSWIALKGTKYSPYFLPKEFWFGIKDILHCFYTGVSLKGMFWATKEPFLYSGILSFILFISYYLNKNISKKEKLITLLFTALILFSFSWHVLFTVFNGGVAFPAGCIYRFAYIFIFFMLIISYKSFINLKYQSKSFFIILTLIFIFITSLVYFDFNESVNKNLVLYDGIFGLLLISLLFLLSNNSKLENIIFLILLFANFGELTLNSYVCFNSQNSAKLSTPKEFKTNYNNVSELLKRIKFEDNGFYRIDTEESFQNKAKTIHPHNISMLHNYRGITHYSSLGNLKLRDFYHLLGFYSSSHNNIFTYNDNLPLFAPSFLGIKYIISDKKEHINPYILISENTAKPIYIYQNPYVFPIGFISENDILKLREIKDINTVELYNILPKMITGKDYGNIYEVLDLCETKLSALNTIAKIRAVVPSQRQFWILQNGGFSFISVNNKEIRQPNYTLNSYIEYLGRFNENEELNIIAFNPKADDDIDNHKFSLFYENEEIFKQYYNLIKQNSIEFTSYTSSFVSAKFLTKNNYQVLLLTIPFDDNWEIKIDNKCVIPQRIFNSMTAILIENDGEHTLEMKYKLKSFKYGLLISIIFLFIFIYFIKRKEN